MNWTKLQSVVFLTAYKAGVPDDENIQNNEMLRQTIANAHYRYSMVLGCWKGHHEKTFMVAVDGMDDVNKLAQIADFHGQEAILYRDQYQNACLITKDSSETMGKMVQVHKDIALAGDSWTQDPATGAFYIIKYGD